MEEKKHQDNLESLFNKTFNHLGKFPEEASWNVPSDKVWEEVHDRIQTKKSPRIRPIFWWAAAAMVGFVLLTGIGQHYYYQQQLTQISDQLKSNEERVKEMQAEMQILKSGETNGIAANNSQPVLEQNHTLEAKVSTHSTIQVDRTATNSSNTIPPQAPVIAKVSQQSGGNEEQQGFNALQSTSSRKDVLANDAPSSVVAIAETSNTVTPVSLESVEDVKSTTVLLAQEALPIFTPIALSNLNMPPLATKKNFDFDSAEKVSPIVRLNQKPDPQFYVGGSISPLWFLHQAASKRDNPVARNVGEESEKIYRAGLQLGVALHSNWMIETGLNLTSSTMKTQRPHQVAYSSVNERMNEDGLYESSYDLTLTTKSGAIETDISLRRRPSASIEEGDQIDLELDLATETMHLEMPVIGKYQVNLGLLAINARAGIVSRYLLDKQFSVNGVEAQTVGFTHHNTEVKRPDVGLNRTGRLSFHYILGLGLDYHINRNWSIALEPTYERGFSPIYEFSDKKIYQEMLGINVGVRYWL